MVKHNNILPNVHLRKKNWDMRVKTWFNQPGKKVRRRRLREEKAAAVFPRPTAGALRPIVRCPTQRYSMRTRLGRGFTLEELKAANVAKRLAPTIGIAVDHRRRNATVADFEVNVQRLKDYMARLVVFPLKGKAAEAAEATQLKGVIAPLPKERIHAMTHEITEEDKKSVYQQQRVVRGQVRAYGKTLRKKEEEAAKKRR